MAVNYPNKEAFATEQLEIQSWFWPEATRTYAEQTLSGLDMGFFLVRPSSQPNCMALSHVVKGNKVGHALIMKNNEVVTLEGTQREFNSIDHLVGMLNLTEAEMPADQKEKLAERRKALFENETAHKAQYQARVTEAKQQGEMQAKLREARENERKKEREDRLKAEEENRRKQLSRKRELMANISDLERRVESKLNQFHSANRFNERETEQAKAVFEEFDNLHVGGFTREDVINVFEDQMGESLSPADIDAFMAELDKDGNKIVTFDEFLEAIDLLDDEVQLVDEPLGNLSPRRQPLQHSRSARPSVRKTQGGMIRQ